MLRSLSQGLARQLAISPAQPRLWPGLGTAGPSLFHTSALLERARKGTREKKAKLAIANKKKKEERLRKRPPPLPKKIMLMLRNLRLPINPRPLRAVETELTFPEDDVYQMRHHCYPRCAFEEAVAELKVHFSPGVLNRPDDVLHAKIELNMKGAKQGKYVEEFNKYVAILHRWDETVAEKRICAFVPTQELEAEALAGGALMTGGQELIQNIVKGRVEISEIDHFVCHEDLVPLMKTAIGVLREKTPQRGQDTVGTDIKQMVQTFKSGMEISVQKVKPSLIYPNEPEYGYTEVPIGLLTQNTDEMKANLNSALDSLMEGRSKKISAGFVTRIILKLQDSPHYTEYSIVHDTISDVKLQQYQEQQRKTAVQADS